MINNLINFFRYLKSDIKDLYHNLLMIENNKIKLDLEYYKFIKKSYNLRYWYLRRSDSTRFDILLSKLDEKIKTI